MWIRIRMDQHWFGCPRSVYFKVDQDPDPRGFVLVRFPWSGPAYGCGFTLKPMQIRNTALKAMTMYGTVPPVINKQKVQEKKTKKYLFLLVPVSLKPLKKSAGTGSISVIKNGNRFKTSHYGSGAFLCFFVLFWILTRASGIRYSRWTSPDHISKSLEQFFVLKILKFFDADADPGSFWTWIGDRKIRIQDPV